MRIKNIKPVRNLSLAKHNIISGSSGFKESNGSFKPFKLNLHEETIDLVTDPNRDLQVQKRRDLQMR